MLGRALSGIGLSAESVDSPMLARPELAGDRSCDALQSIPAPTNCASRSLVASINFGWQEGRGRGYARRWPAPARSSIMSPGDVSRCFKPADDVPDWRDGDAG